jgi:xylulokinase
VYFGIDEFTMNKAHIARAAMEGVTLGIRYGLESMKQEGISPTDIRLTGGGSKSEIWRQIAADVFNAEAVNMEIEEAASFGAAIQAMWCYTNFMSNKTSISDLTDEMVRLREETRKTPQNDAVSMYDELYSVQTEVSVALRSAFESHRKLISKE